MSWTKDVDDYCDSTGGNEFEAMNELGLNIDDTIPDGVDVFNDSEFNDD